MNAHEIEVIAKTNRASVTLIFQILNEIRPLWAWCFGTSLLNDENFRVQMIREFKK